MECGSGACVYTGVFLLKADFMTSLTGKCNLNKPVLKLKEKLEKKKIKGGFNLFMFKIIIIITIVVVVIVITFTYTLKQSPESKDKSTHLLRFV